MAAEAHPAVFASALREWRRRRRVSQLELALRAGTSQRHVSFIEGGRSLPGRAMVVRLAESLEVPLRERNALLLAAGYAPAYDEARWDDTKLEPVRTALERVLDGHLFLHDSRGCVEVRRIASRQPRPTLRETTPLLPCIELESQRFGVR